MKLHKLHETKTLNEMLDQGPGPTDPTSNVDELNRRLKKLETASQNASNTNMAVSQQVRSLEDKVEQGASEAKPAINNSPVNSVNGKPTPGGQARTPDIARF